MAINESDRRQALVSLLKDVIQDPQLEQLGLILSTFLLAVSVSNIYNKSAHSPATSSAYDEVLPALQTVEAANSDESNWFERHPLKLHIGEVVTVIKRQSPARSRKLPSRSEMIDVRIQSLSVAQWQGHEVFSFYGIPLSASDMPDTFSIEQIVKLHSTLPSIN